MPIAAAVADGTEPLPHIKRYRQKTKKHPELAAPEMGALHPARGKDSDHRAYELDPRCGSLPTLMQAIDEGQRPGKLRASDLALDAAQCDAGLEDLLSLDQLV